MKTEPLTKLVNPDGAGLEWTVNLVTAGAWRFELAYRCENSIARRSLTVDGLCQGDVHFTRTGVQAVRLEVTTLQLAAGEHTLALTGDWGQLAISETMLVPVPNRSTPQLSFSLCHPNASRQARLVMDYLKSIHGRGILTGQHTAAAAGAEIAFLEYHTGKLPALRGFDLLGYSSAVMPPEMTPAAIVEVAQNRGSVDAAIRWWTERRGLVTLCWHWYSPLAGSDKSFYTKNTSFDLGDALVPGSPGYLGLERDMDLIAECLKRLRDAGVPVLWRPLHESDGGWFWWGAKGAEPYKALYRWMYERYTVHHGLNNLIWVWNAPEAGMYPGDDVTDLSSIDIYAPDDNAGPLTAGYDLAFELAGGNKPVALAENGVVPDMDELVRSRTPWLWYMSWGGFIMDPRSNRIEHLKRVCRHPYAITSDRLPAWLFA